MTFSRSNRNGFTLIETMAALTIMLAALMLSIGGFMFMQKNQIQQIAKDTIDSETHMAAARLQHEMRLSSLSEMVFYPSTAQKYTAVSFPIASTDDEGNFPLNSEGKIDWTSTIIYHAHGEGEDLRLLRTEFVNRDNTLSISDRQNQLNQVVADGQGNGTVNGENANTSTLFERVFSWEIIPQGSSYDGYGSGEKLDRSASMGAFNLTPGLHTLKLTTTGKDSRSSGYTMGFDTLRISSSGLHREAEAQSGASSFNLVEDPSGMSSGNHQLIIESQGVGESIVLNFYNDRWEDTNFDLSGAVKSNTTVGAIDTSYTPTDFTLKLTGNTTNWSAKAQSWDGDMANEADEGGRNCPHSDFYGKSIIRVILRGQDLAQASGSTVDPLDLLEGAGCKISFKSSALIGDGDLFIRRAYIDTCISSTNITPHTQGDPKKITFNNGSDWAAAYDGSPLWSDPIDFPISWENSYAITFQTIDISGNWIYPYLWQDTNLVTSTYMIPNSANLDYLTDANWTSPFVTNLPYIVAVDKVLTTYASAGTYTSPSIDTLMDQPEFESVDWTEDIPTGTQLSIKVRSASTPDMAGAKDWDLVSTLPSPGSLTSIRQERYLQYQVLMESSAKGIDTPKLRDISFQWPGETRAVNIGGIFVNGPGYGQFEARIDDQPLTSPLRISLELQQSVRGFNNTMEIITSGSTFELNPRNNGR